MKKLLIIPALAALTLAGCGAASAPAKVPTEHESSTKIYELGQLADNNMFEVTGINSDGKQFRCYITEGSQTVAQTCFEYGPPAS